MYAILDDLFGWRVVRVERGGYRRRFGGLGHQRALVAPTREP